MAIPTMSHSSSSILEVTEASALVYLAEEVLRSSTEKDNTPLIRTETGSLTQHIATGQTGITTVFTQAACEHAFSPSVAEHGLFQPQLSKRPEHSSWTQGVTAARHFPQHRTHLWACHQASHEIGLCLHGPELCCCSDLTNVRSGCAELNSDPESMYIYAESIQGCDTSCSDMPKVCDSLHLSTELAKLSQEVAYDATSFWNKAFETKRRSRSLDTDSEMVYMNTGEKSNFDSADYSIEAVHGSDFSYDSESVRGNYDSASTCTDSGWSFDSHGAEANTDSLYSPTEVQPGSRSSMSSSSSNSSHYTADRGPDSPFCTVERHISSDSEDCFGAGRFDSFGSHLEEASYDLYNALPQSRGMLSYGGKDLGHDLDSDSPGFKDCTELPLSELRGVVTHTTRCHFSVFFREMVKNVEQERDLGKVNVSEGFLFHPQKFLQAKNSEYREGREYSLLRHLQNGSYGDVFSVRDKQTGFTCAAKRIPLCSFSWEEVAIWSQLDSPRVLQLFGAVREGFNVVLFMDLKAGSLAQLLKEKGSLPEDLALHYYCQVLQALEHMHSRQVIHLDVKGQGLRGTESHVSPEVARGDPHSDRADVWSSCCMLLHMLTGHQPWTRYYAHPLCLKIVSEPAPLWEIPPGCNPLTFEVIRGGLVKEPVKRDSARELLVKATRALRTVGGFCDPLLSSTQALRFLSNIPEHQSWPSSSLVQVPGLITITTQETLCPVPAISSPASMDEEQLSAPRIQWVSPWRERAGEEDERDLEAQDSDEESKSDSEGWRGKMEQHKMRDWMEMYGGNGEDLAEILNEQQTGDPVDEAEQVGDYEDSWVAEEREALKKTSSAGEGEEWEPFLRTQILYGTKQQRNAAPNSKDEYSDTKEESITSAQRSRKRYLPEPNSKFTFTCHRSICASEPELTDKDSDCSDDWSSGVFSSCSSLTSEQSFNVDWSVSTNQPPSCCFEGLGVDIWVEDVSGETLKIREKLKVKLGHVAVGISAQISMRTFSLATLDGKLVSPDAEVLESGMWLQCVPAPDGCPTWDWRVRDGKIEMQEYDGLQSDTCSTLAA
ncbi:uncharacterized protein LOC113583770 isoform X2 [Electrophorus electricus]|uniref:uncharacterized protein LOC113583770 isoform X2 n=1 Tax=Electrophorus electricus TaxID=8005 RepID=UPI0015CFFBBD|nr:uncharacterized protein LOC113583770 isoform X2 [Electrophorus electricus]